MHTLAKCAVVFGLLLCLGMGSQLLGQPKTGRFPKPSSDNTNGGPSDFQRQYGKVEVQRNVVVEHAIFILNEMQPNETATGDYLEAIQALRVFRAAEGIDVLTRQLRYEPTYIEFRRTYDAYVASGPLIAIGPPAISAMLNVIRDPQRTDVERRVACWVLLNIEASADRDLEPDSDAVRDAVIQRLSTLKYLRHGEDVAVEEAKLFIQFFAITEGRWQELPVITNPPRPIRIGQSVRHQFQCQKPLEHPNAVIEFLPSVTELEDLGLKLSKSGELTGTPKGTCRFTIRAKATWKSDCGKSEESSEGANQFALGVFSDE